MHNKIRAHAKNGVFIEVGIVIGEDLGHKRAVAGGGHDIVQMRGPPRVPPAGAQDISDRAIRGHGVFHGFHGCEGVATVFAKRHQAVKREGVLVIVLAGIEAVRGGLPDVDFGAGNGVAVGVADDSFGEEDRTTEVALHVPADFEGRRAGDVEGAENRRRCRVGALVQHIDQ